MMADSDTWTRMKVATAGMDPTMMTTLFSTTLCAYQSACHYDAAGMLGPRLEAELTWQSTMVLAAKWHQIYRVPLLCRQEQRHRRQCPWTWISNLAKADDEEAYIKAVANTAINCTRLFRDIFSVARVGRGRTKM